MHCSEKGRLCTDTIKFRIEKEWNKEMKMEETNTKVERKVKKEEKSFIEREKARKWTKDWKKKHAQIKEMETKKSVTEK